jgi:hypothetical protein
MKALREESDNVAESEVPISLRVDNIEFPT